ncbi:low molecular weight phosphotyrosine protein phosphatase [Amycolatopsis acidiphila]|uniref:protein-tyrosine-phosphatase n=1 Tax=Amycolatopsis acidiphila TaxID=715473 RepID=A0A558A185_9PSEU|nr:low molecular weight protein-tyrosine-phosphatase [Amycolatopsis acidiphila]TVT18014.1 low molecular weight phosphotyrosine protein phosphatase [Amycolatopsis acidiphila]UIJ61034.1 low molecular weight phosphotyrosine protein phosphatase [Amycolatopsis acidiphila]GHG88985.1 protein-tyrosine-phosphatase [Amycolatopsis acidiphila]
MTEPALHVCFVCSGNICRSPMAAVVFREHLRRDGLAGQVRVSSAGIGPWHVGEPADARALATLEQHGYDGKHVAAQIDGEHLGADLLLAADAGHLRDLRRKIDDPSRVRLLREFDPSAPEGAEVPDPYYGGEDGFEDALAMIERTMPGLLDWTRRGLGTLHG